MLWQIELHPHLASSDLVEFCKQNDIRVQAYSSLGTSSANNQVIVHIFSGQLNAVALWHAM